MPHERAFDGAGDPEMNDLAARMDAARGRSDVAPEPLHLLDPRDWQDRPIPTRQWIVPDWLPCGVATGLYGPPGYGKTLLAQQLMTATTLGQPWLGKTTRMVRSIGFFCEDDEDELHRRQQAINQSYGCDYADLGAMRLISRLGFDNLLMTFHDSVGTPTALYYQIIDEAKAFGADLVLVDTVADTFGGDQNNMSHARQFVQFALAGIARSLGPSAAVIACAHPSQTGKNSGSGESGSVQWDAAFRSRAYLDTPKPNGSEPAEGERTLTRKKANYASRNETIELEWYNGVFVPKYQHGGILGAIEKHSCEEITLMMLDRMETEKQPVSANSRAGNYAPRIFVRRPENQYHFKTADFERAIQVLLSTNQICNLPYGRKSDQRTRLIRHPHP